MKTLYKINTFLKKIFPEKLYFRIRSILLKLYQLRLHVFTEKEIREIIHGFGIEKGAVVFVHSSMNQIKTEFPFYKLIDILMDIVGKEGTILFPCWQNIPDLNEYIKQDKVFNVKRTPTLLGLLPEIARRRSDAIRSLSPFNSVVAIGQKAKEMVMAHHLDDLPCGVKSPFFKLIENDGFILGLGVTTRYLTFVHCVEDAFPSQFPVQTRYQEDTPMKVKTLEGEEIIVNIRLPHENIKRRDIPAYLKNHINPDIAKDIKIKNTNFYIARAKPLFNEMQKLAKENITIYK